MFWFLVKSRSFRKTIHIFLRTFNKTFKKISIKITKLKSFKNGDKILHFANEHVKKS